MARIAITMQPPQSLINYETFYCKKGIESNQKSNMEFRWRLRDEGEEEEEEEQG